MSFSSIKRTPLLLRLLGFKPYRRWVYAYNEPQIWYENEDHWQYLTAEEVA